MVDLASPQVHDSIAFQNWMETISCTVHRVGPSQNRSYSSVQSTVAAAVPELFPTPPEHETMGPGAESGKDHDSHRAQSDVVHDAVEG